MPLLKARRNILPLASTAPVSAKVNVDSLRVDGAYDFDDASGGGTFPATAVFPVSVVVSAGGDTQTLTDDNATVFVRNFGLEWWGLWA